MKILSFDHGEIDGQWYHHGILCADEKEWRRREKMEIFI
jgi:hypothetical protein